MESPPGSLPVQPDEAPTVAPVHIKLPPYWAADPQIWFAQVEAQFSTRRVLSQRSKFAHVVAALQPEIAQEVRDLLLDPPTVDPFIRLKAELIRRTSKSEQRRLQLLLTEEELGDRRPSQLLRKMRQLLGEHEMEQGILKQLFVQRLPASVQLILATASTALSTEQLADLADRIMDVPLPSVQVVQPPASAQPALAELKGEVARLSELVRSLQVQVRNSSRSRSRGRATAGRRSERTDSQTTASETDASSVSSDHSDLCWYHDRWGSRAHKCRPPCAYDATPAGNV